MFSQVDFVDINHCIPRYAMIYIHVQMFIQIQYAEGLFLASPGTLTQARHVSLRTNFIDWSLGTRSQLDKQQLPFLRTALI